ncbi:PRC-barrel domain-containing protein [Bradyrhizobium sp. WYCCWR 13022]|uniref:PRC-barrel domain-containing protein n=1 Tax=unclassified Bradyrhizobium TaxID=2631580 RepID=UPI00263A9288|nr:PRC-barrel domain-containing protein [Bradyrhizobium sp. WYCCWR 13022]MDN4986299.1 PRC-barrel domain-containing protein [Bradyrhizobium sp. WYCCWR 13022]
MKATSFLAAAALVGASSLAMAQSAPQTGRVDHSAAQTSDRNQSADQRAESSMTNKAVGKADAAQSDTRQAGVRQQMVNDLQQAGFTDVKLRPQSFLVEAKDRSGNPVTMFVGPNTFAEVKTVGANAQKSSSNNSPSNSANVTSDRPGGAFTSVPPKDGLSSQLMGLQVYNDSKQDIGTIKDVALNENGIDGYILSVGGFLGIGDHYVAVRPSAINLKFDHAANKWTATMDTTADQLKSAPEFKYPSNG